MGNLMPKSQDKGSSFERIIARRLSEWVSNGIDSHIFARRSGSGGAPRDKRGFSGAAGDIFADKIIGKWLTDHTSFELKCYGDLLGPFWNTLAGNTSIFDSFVYQAKESAEPYGRTWSLVFKSSRKEIMVFTNSLPMGDFVPTAFKGKLFGEQVALFTLRAFLIEGRSGELRNAIAEYENRIT